MRCDDIPENTENTRYSINGFRSLIDFEIDLKPGVNALVGTNGSGKTNFIDFLDFLETTVRSSAANAVSGSGGVSRVFSQENIKKRSPAVSCKFSGVAELPNSIKSEWKDYPYFRFDYELEVRFSRSHSALYISKELIKLYKLTNDALSRMANRSVGLISVRRRTPDQEVPPTWNVGPRLLTTHRRNPLAVERNIYSKRTVEDNLDRADFRSLAPDESILSIRSVLPALDAIRLAISRGQSFNINPESVRAPDDLTRLPGISRDGSGLSSTLFNLQISKRSRRAPAVRLRRATPDSLDTICEWTKLVFPALQEITVSQDPHTGKYLGALVVRRLDSETPLRIPFQSASDGTLKWLSLVTLIMTSPSTYSIEEPENYLHPKMQQFLTELIREYLPEMGRSSYFLISTHSETLINQFTAEELIIFDFENGKTVCRRISNPERVKEEINKTGFGLGYFYASNALS